MESMRLTIQLKNKHKKVKGFRINTEFPSTIALVLNLRVSQIEATKDRNKR